MDSWWSETSRSANNELEAAVARGKSRYGSVTVTGQGVRTRKLTFDVRRPQVEFSTPLSIFVPRAARQRKVARPQPRSPVPRADPEGQFVYK